MVTTTSQRKKGLADFVTAKALQFMALSFNRVPKYNRYLKTDQGWLNFSVGLRTENGSVAQTIIFKDGKVSVAKGIPEDVSGEMTLMDENALKQMATLPPNEILNLLLKNKMVTRGNMTHLQIFNFFISVLLYKKQIGQINKQKAALVKLKKQEAPAEAIPPKKIQLLRAVNVDPGVEYLTDDPYLSEYTLSDFPRLKKFVDIHFTQKPAVCIERAAILTNWFKINGFENDRDGRPWEPVLRQGYAFKHLMENRKPIIRKDDLIAGTTTTKEIGVPLYPDAQGTLLWGELLTLPYRGLNPYDVTEDDINELHHHIYPFWVNRNFREWVRDYYDQPLGQKLDERWAVNFLWKSVSLSHTIIDYPKLLRIGARGIINEIEAELAADTTADQLKKDTLKAMILSYEGVISYARHLSEQAKAEAKTESSPQRKKELERLAEITASIPEDPCQTLDEAVNALWIHWVAVHMENTNAGFSLGRMDQWLQPFFAADMAKIDDQDEKKAYIEYAIELIGCFYMRCTDHLPTIPDIGNYLFGGSSSDQAITLGGVTPEGEDAVNDMTYIFLKVTEMLAIRDPNVNARFHNDKNSETYLRRLCEVNYNTAATPSIHNDEMVMESLAEFNYPPEHLRDWSATGCVEPTLSGRHMGHTNCMMFNMVAALEMALYNGYHPLMRWKLGPDTGEVNDFKNFEEFFQAFTEQLSYIGGLACEYNNMLGEAHSVIRPTPLISAMMDGSIDKGRDVTLGGALYNTSGNACIGLADVTDSLMVIKKLVYEEKKTTLAELQEAVKTNFENHSALRAMALNKVPLFGSGNPEAVEMANRVTSFIHDFFGQQRNFRGGPYTVGFWSMSNHVAFGTLTGALPSGRLAGLPFTPGLTPEAHASKSLLDNIRDVCSLDIKNMNNNIAFNVKVVPGAQDTPPQIVDNIYSYAKAYCDLGGMQMQFNVLSTDTLRDAMVHPEEYRQLLVRISGYNAYFVTLDRELQLELIRRAEYGL